MFVRQRDISCLDAKYSLCTLGLPTQQLRKFVIQRLRMGTCCSFAKFSGIAYAARRRPSFRRDRKGNLKANVDQGLSREVIGRYCSEPRRHTSNPLRQVLSNLRQPLIADTRECSRRNYELIDAGRR